VGFAEAIGWAISAGNRFEKASNLALAAAKAAAMLFASAGVNPRQNPSGLRHILAAQNEGLDRRCLAPAGG